MIEEVELAAAGMIKLAASEHSYQNMKYLLNDLYQFRGWYKLPCGIYNKITKKASFYNKDLYMLLLKCDGAHDFDESEFSEKDLEFLHEQMTKGIIRLAMAGEYLSPEQEYVNYPARYIEDVHWSITGSCNLRCRHCFMSAPNSKHGALPFEKLVKIADQYTECGIFSVSLTGGEPLIRKDFFDILDMLKEREISVSTIYTNAWLVDEKLLERLTQMGLHPDFQLSFDGIGIHDFLRGVKGSEEKTLFALKLLKEWGTNVSVSMCMHRKNREVLRESVKLMASLGVKSMKCGKMIELGEWVSSDVQNLHLSYEEELETFEKYIPQYFEDDAPLTIMLGNTFMYTPGDNEWSFYAERRCTGENEKEPSCEVLVRKLYVGAEGMVAPCMGMGDCGFSSHFPNIFDTPLKEILHDSEFTDLCRTSVKQIRDHNPKCRTCPYMNRCTGGCRNEVLSRCDDYYGIDENLCYFFENGWDDRFRKAAAEPFKAYLKRNPPKDNVSEQVYIR